MSSLKVLKVYLCIAKQFYKIGISKQLDESEFSKTVIVSNVAVLIKYVWIRTHHHVIFKIRKFSYPNANKSDVMLGTSELL